MEKPREIKKAKRSHEESRRENVDFIADLEPLLGFFAEIIVRF